jgi:hypothetical protein
MKHLKLLLENVDTYNKWLEEQDKLPKETKNKKEWVQLSDEDREKFAVNLKDLIDISYKRIGGHHKIKQYSDVAKKDNMYNVWRAIDIDGDDEYDAVTFSNRSNIGTKVAGMGSKSNRSKQAVLSDLINCLKNGDYYTEASGKPVDLFLKNECPYLKSKEEVEMVIGKQVEWLGVHPDGIHPNVRGWYKRTISGHEEIKLMIGSPIL